MSFAPAFYYASAAGAAGAAYLGSRLPRTPGSAYKRQRAESAPTASRTRQRLFEPNRPRDEMNQGRSGCLTRRRKRYGRRITKRKFDSRLLKSTTLANVYRLQGLNSACTLTSATGFYKLLSSQAGAGTTVYTPLTIFDVTAFPNNGKTCVNGFGLTLSNETSTSTASFNQLPGWASQNYQFASEGSEAYAANARSMLGWISAKFMFYAPTTVPVKVQIDLVQFKEDDVTPGGRLPVAGAVAVPSGACTAFWQGMLKEYMWNPLEPGNKRLENKYIRYLKRDSFILDCKTTVENEATHYKKYDWYAKLNRYCAHDWNQEGRMGMTDTTYETNSVAGGAAGENVTSSYVDPKARVYLMIRAYSGFKGASAAFDATVHPSFDMVMRKKHFFTA